MSKQIGGEKKKRDSQILINLEEGEYVLQKINFSFHKPFLILLPLLLVEIS